MGCGASVPAGAAEPARATAGVAPTPKEDATEVPSAPAGGLRSASFNRERRTSVEAELEALGHDVSLVVDVETFLESIELEQYYAAFEAAGYIELPSLANITEEKLRQLSINKAGHVKKLLKHIAAQNQEAHASPSPSPMESRTAPTVDPLELAEGLRCRRSSAEEEINAIDADVDAILDNDDEVPAQPEPQPEALKRQRSARTSYAELPDENGEIDTIADTISTVTPTSADVAAAEAAGAFDATPEPTEPVAIADSGSAAGGASDADGANSDEVRPARKSEPAVDDGLSALDQPGSVAG